MQEYFCSFSIPKISTILIRKLLMDIDSFVFCQSNMYSFSPHGQLELVLLYDLSWLSKEDHTYMLIKRMGEENFSLAKPCDIAGMEDGLTPWVRPVNLLGKHTRLMVYPEISAAQNHE